MDPSGFIVFIEWAAAFIQFILVDSLNDPN